MTSSSPSLLLQPATPECLLVLVLTIFLWISLFGIVDTLLTHIESNVDRLLCYCLIGIVPLTYVYLSPKITYCDFQ